MNGKHAFTLSAVGLSIALAPHPTFGQQAGPGKMTILIVCGDENRTYAKCTSLDDRFLELHLRLDLGHRVTMMPDDTGEPSLTAHHRRICVSRSSPRITTTSARIIG